MGQQAIDKSQIDTGSLYQFDGEQGWDDLIGVIASGKTIVATDPSWVAFRGGVYAYSFSATAMNEVWLTFHVTHSYAPDTVIYPHIHWTTAGTNTGTVRWGIEYTVAKGYDQESFPTTTTIYLEQPATGTAYQHNIIEATLGQAIPTTHLETDALIMVRVFRDGAHANDTCTDAAFGLMCDLHVQTAAPNTKNRNYPFA